MYEHVIAYYSRLAKICVEAGRSGNFGLTRGLWFDAADHCNKRCTEYTRLAVQAEAGRAA